MNETMSIAVPRVQGEAEDRPAGFDLMIHQHDLLMTAGETMLKSGLAGHLKNPQAAAMVALKCVELGIPLTQGLSQMYVISGKLACMGQLMLALMFKAGGYVDIKESDGRCDCSVVRGSVEYFASYTRDEAKNAGLYNNPAWNAYESEMLLWRAVARLARRAYPDVIGGLTLPDEAREAESPEANVAGPSVREMLSDPVPDDAVESAANPILTDKERDALLVEPVEEAPISLVEKSPAVLARSAHFARAGELGIDTEPGSEHQAFCRVRYNVASRSDMTEEQHEDMRANLETFASFYQTLGHERLKSLRASLEPYLASVASVDRVEHMSWDMMSKLTSKLVERLLPAKMNSFPEFVMQVLEWDAVRCDKNRLMVRCQELRDQLADEWGGDVAALTRAIDGYLEPYMTDRAVVNSLLERNHLSLATVRRGIIESARKIVEASNEPSSDKEGPEGNGQGQLL